MSFPNPLKSILRTAALTALVASCVVPPPPPVVVVPVPAPEPTAPAERLPDPVVPVSETPPALDREFRAAWVASVANIDWPSRPGLSSAQQQAELLAILDRAAALHLNAVILQVRPAADALYESSLEPWSEYLTGTMGAAPQPYYDPLEFAVREAHERGLELHAWFNPFRARHGSARGPASTDHVSARMPDHVLQYGKLQWMDPGSGDVHRHALAVIADVVRRYDIDGVHIDDYFYPYKERDSTGRLVEFPDTASWRRYTRGGGRLTRDDWRRDNVNRFVEQMYATVKREKPWVKVGISPFGIWRPGSPAGVSGLDAYQEIYADARRWVHEGWLDYNTPQLYWRAASPRQRYDHLLEWWVAQNRHGRHVWPGNFTSRVGESDQRWEPTEILEQIRLTREARGAAGNVHFSMRALMENRWGLSDSLRAGPYAMPALVPPSPWLGETAPRAPQVLLTPARDGVTMEITPQGGSAPRFWAVRARTPHGWQVFLLPADRRRVTLAPRTDRVMVSAISRTGVESAWNPVVTASANAPAGVGSTP